MIEMPKRVCGAQLKPCDDGTYKLIVSSPQAEAWLDRHYTRIRGARKWFPGIDTKLVDTLRPIFENKGVYLIGKGPSLDVISEKHFPDSEIPIIAINDSIHKIETLTLSNPLYMMQQDTRLTNNTCPIKATIVCTVRASGNYKAYSNKLIYYPGQLGETYGSLTVICAIRLCHLVGTTHFKLLCFDSCVDQNCDYANCIGYRSDLTRGKKRFLTHRKRIIKMIGNKPFEFIKIVP